MKEDMVITPQGHSITVVAAAYNSKIISIHTALT